MTLDKARLTKVVTIKNVIVMKQVRDSAFENHGRPEFSKKI